jgi:hypothetical protein
MYKKITHNITEEHFAHPLAAELKKKVEKLVVQPVAQPKPTLKSTIMVTPETQLHMTSHELFGKLVWGVRNYITSELNNAPDTSYISSRLLQDIKEFGPVLTTYYSKKIGDDAVRHLTAFATILTELVQAAKAGKDITKLTVSEFGHLDDLASVISIANPVHWPEPVVKEFLHTYFTHVIEQVTARIKKDWEADMIASTKASNVLTSGPVSEGILKGMPDFANVFAEGIIKQFPSAFAVLK